MKRFRTIGILAALLLIANLNLATAQVGFSPGIRGGIYTDDNDLFLGADVKADVMMLSLIPNIEYVFVDNATFITINVDAAYDLSVVPMTDLYIGGGLGILYVDPDKVAGFDPDSESELGINVIGGAGFNAVALSPYVQAKYIIATGDFKDQLVISAGIRF